VLLADVSEEHFDKYIGINLKGTLFTVQKALPLMAAGICGIAVTLVRLLHMTEENVGYLNVYDFDLFDLNQSYLRGFSRCGTSAEDAQARGGFWKWLGWLGCRLPPTEPEVQLWPRWAKGSIWQRIRLRSLASEDSYPMWPFAVFYLAIFSLMYITMPSKPTFTMILNALFMTFDPVFSVTSAMPRRRKAAGPGVEVRGRRLQGEDAAAAAGTMRRWACPTLRQARAAPQGQGEVNV
jgi:hypothetical protein